MPDPLKQTVSASQASALYNLSPYATRFMLYHHFVNGLPIGPDDADAEGNERMSWGVLLQDDILAMTARRYRLDITENKENRYARRGSLGATIDGSMIAPDRGPVVVEAKNIDWLRWRDTWTEKAAAPHVEIQTQVGMHAAGAEHGIIAAFVGGNHLLFYEREINKELISRTEEEARLFLESVRDGKEPDPLGSPIELPMLAELYPETNPAEVVEDLDDEELALAIRQFDAARRDETFNRKLKEQMEAIILARSRAAGVLRANGWTCLLERYGVAPGVCQPHASPRVIRKAYSGVRIKVQQTQVVQRHQSPPPLGI
jgi:predicted phage-related endonuclease